MRVYIYNPDHDLALASDSDHFDAPDSAKMFAQDFSVLPLWYAEGNASIYTQGFHKEWLTSLQQLFPQFKNIDFVASFGQNDFVMPWGWNKTIRKFAEKKGCFNLPAIENINCIRELQHRRLSVEATEFLSSLENEHLFLARPASLLTVDEIECFAEKHPYAIFKAPWSGSGKGIVRSLGGLSENLHNRLKNIAKKQGCVLGEPLYDVTQDFAMEFLCEKETTSFAGYSWFFTNEHGVYQGNLLANDEQIAEKFSQWISVEELERIKQRLIDFLNKKVAKYYNGYLGVDMFIFQQENQFHVHPCVEINLRMTMGLVARLFYDKFVENGKTGTYFVDYNNSSEDLFLDTKKRSENELVVKKGRIQKGFLTLNPINETTHYRARIEIT
ncbi:MAG: hypothetical protein MJ198_02295 [Bacteroidales bacterium]|nr:hypothetical protein [Bacteroidales bacterium]